MSFFLTILLIVLVLLLIIQKARVSSAIERLSSTLSENTSLEKNNGEKRRIHSAFIELENQIHQQIFEAHTLEDRVVRREDLITNVVEGLTDAVLVFDGSLNIRFTNRSACELFGWKSVPFDASARECINNFALIGFLEKTLNTEEKSATEITHHLPGRETDPPRILEVDVAPLPQTGSQSSNRVRVVLHDITENRNLDQVRRDFVANASHELRTPLTIINGYLENLEDDGLADREAALRFIAVMHKHGKRIARIIEDMLTISKLESHAKGTIQSNAFKFLPCAQEVIDRLKPVFDERKATYKLIIDDDATILGDAFYWDQILFNLIENSLKENDAEGLIITIQLRNEDEQDIITVSDDGVGIPASAQEFIFKRFYRVDQNRGPEKKGTGLGLSIVKRAVEAHGGTIKVMSTPGIETTFAMEIPKEQKSTD